MGWRNLGIRNGTGTELRKFPGGDTASKPQQCTEPSKWGWGSHSDMTLWPWVVRFTPHLPTPSPCRSQPVGWISASSAGNRAPCWAGPRVRGSLCPQGTVCGWPSVHQPLKTRPQASTRASWLSTKPWVRVPPGCREGSPCPQPWPRYLFFFFF